MAEFLALKDGSHIDVETLPTDLMCWRARWKAETYEGDGWTSRGERKAPLQVFEWDHNMLVRGGASLMWEYAIGLGSTAAANAKKYVNATAALGVGNSTVAATNIQLALQAASSRQLVKALTGGFPTHTTGSTAATVADVVFKSTFGVTEANFAWAEFGLFNKATTTARRMLTRKVQALLTKTSAASATLTLTITLA
jgi:hypothetical protein